MRGSTPPLRKDLVGAQEPEAARRTVAQCEKQHKSCENVTPESGCPLRFTNY